MTLRGSDPVPIIVDEVAPRDVAFMVNLADFAICERCWKLLCKSEDVTCDHCSVVRWDADSEGL